MQWLYQFLNMWEDLWHERGGAVCKRRTVRVRKRMSGARTTRWSACLQVTTLIEKWKAIEPKALKSIRESRAVEKKAKKKTGVMYICWSALFCGPSNVLYNVCVWNLGVQWWHSLCVCSQHGLDWFPKEIKEAIMVSVIKNTIERQYHQVRSPRGMNFWWPHSLTGSDLFHLTWAQPSLALVRPSHSSSANLALAHLLFYSCLVLVVL